MKIKSGTETSYKSNASDFSAQVARMKVDGCDLVVLGTIVRETIGAIQLGHSQPVAITGGNKKAPSLK
jgi:hypothetical protein